MAAPKRTKDERERDLEKVAEQYLTGKRQVDIAVLLNVSAQQISYDLKVLNKRWQESALASTDIRKAQELAKIDALEAEYWEGWRRSCRDGGYQASEKTSGGEEEKAKVSMRKFSRDGNPEFLAGVGWCIEQRCKILGIVQKDVVQNNLILNWESISQEMARPLDEIEAKIAAPLKEVQQVESDKPHGTNGVHKNGDGVGGHP